jgi:hypothetical protein
MYFEKRSFVAIAKYLACPAFQNRMVPSFTFPYQQLTGPFHRPVNMCHLDPGGTLPSLSASCALAGESRLKNYCSMAPSALAGREEVPSHLWIDGDRYV